MATQEEPAAKPPEPLKYKTWVLKVSVHCEGCKRKVKKILHAIEGVYVVDVDIKLHRATVTGNVDSATLIRKLEKSGKHAELWPEKTEQKEGKKNKKKKKDKQDDKKDSEGNNDDSFTPADKEKPESTKDDASVSPSKAVDGANVAKTGGGAQKKEAKPKAEQEKPPAENPQSPESGPADDSAPGGNEGGAGKKKKKKGNKGNNGDGNNNQSQPNCGDDKGAGKGIGEATRTQAGPNGRVAAKGKAPDNGSFPLCDRTPAYYGPPPVYAVSYNTAYPSSNNTASYYASPPPYSHAYVQQGSEGSPMPSDSYEMFSDENPNACFVM